jgi:hypothetical protein
VELHIPILFVNFDTAYLWLWSVLRVRVNCRHVLCYPLYVLVVIILFYKRVKIYGEGRAIHFHFKEVRFSTCIPHIMNKNIRAT